MSHARITLRLVGELNQLLDKEAKTRGITKNALLVQILWDWAKKMEVVKR